MNSLGTRAPDFSLPDTHGKLWQRSDFSGRPLLVMFLSNHCPFVKHLAPALAQLSQELADGTLGSGAPGLVGMVGINANDVERYPADSPAAMKREVEERGYRFPYLFDQSQEVPKAYGAMCTPDFYLFDKDHALVYHGQFDGSRPTNAIPVSGADLRAAINAVLAGKRLELQQKPSIGCGIKWRPGNEPD